MKFIPTNALICLFIAAFSMLSHQVNAQGVAGGEKAHNWQDKEFAPDEKNGAVHLRFGRGGLMSGILLNPRAGITRGNPSCDLSYLYYIKRGKPIPPAEREECALNEYKLANLWTYESLVALNNSFTKAKVLETYLPQVDSRMQLLAKAKRFYVRASVEVTSIDPRTMVGDFSFFLTDQNWQVGAEGAPIMVSAKGSAIGRFEPLQPLPPALAQRLEESRVANLIDTSRGEVYFDISSVIPADFVTRTNHLLLIENIQYRMYFYTTNNEYRTIANF